MVYLVGLSSNYLKIKKVNKYHYYNIIALMYVEGNNANWSLVSRSIVQRKADFINVYNILNTLNVLKSIVSFYHLSNTIINTCTFSQWNYSTD